jgi:hypothetical protein
LSEELTDQAGVCALSIRQIWRDFSAFWKSQVYWSLVASLIAIGWQYHKKGLFSGSIKDTLWTIAVTYISVVGIFLVFNIGRAVSRSEWKTLKKREHDERRAERKGELEREKSAAPKPNLKFRRIFSERTPYGHELNPNPRFTVLLEIGNDLTNRAVGVARNVRAHLTYKDKDRKTVHISCPAHWGINNTRVTIAVGESRVLTMAVLQSTWRTYLHSGVSLPEETFIEVRFLDDAGQEIGDLMVFDCRFGSGSGDMNPVCTKLQ